MALADRANAVLWDFRVVGARTGDAAWGKIQKFEETANEGADWG